MFSDESVELPVEPITIDLLTIRLEKKPSLSLLFTESSSRSEEGSGDPQMLPYLSNKAFSTKSTQYIRLEQHRKPIMALDFLRLNEVCSS